jgi:hypothetical protein
METKSTHLYGFIMRILINLVVHLEYGLLKNQIRDLLTYSVERFFDANETKLFLLVHAYDEFSGNDEVIRRAGER